MSNPTPNQASSKGAPPKASAKAADQSQDEPKAEKGGDPAPTRYRVLKAITLADGRTLMPGEEFVPDDSFPSRRPKQLVEQKFLRPID